MRFFDRFKAKNEQSGQAETTAPTANSIAKGFPASPLIKACEANDFDAAMRLLKEGADPNEKSPDGRTPLFFCSEVALICLLLHFGADANATDNDGNTALMTILNGENVNSNGERAVVVLIEAGTDVEVRNRDGLTARDIAASRKAPLTEFDRYLIDSGGDVETESHDEMYAAYEQGLRVVGDTKRRIQGLEERQRAERERWLEESDPLNPDYDFGRMMIECYNACALSEISVLKAHENTVRHFINMTVNRSSLSNSSMTMLMMACENASAEIVEYLISLGADVNQVDGSGQAALRYAAVSWLDVEKKIDLLVKAGADVNHLSNDGSAALSDAAFHQNVAAAQALIARGADVNNRDSQGYTALSWTCGQGAPNADMVELLLRCGANVNDLYEACCVLQYIDYVNVSGYQKSREVWLHPNDLKERYLYEHALLPAMLTPGGREKFQAQGFGF